jgi:glutamate-1-semialdehyde 2,1-aminomutase
VQTITRTQALAERAKAVIPGGVNSINRVMPWPFSIASAEGAYLTDADGRRLLDYHAAFGPIVLGHCHPRVNQAVFETMARVDIIGAGVTEMEVELAEKIAQHVPSAERVMLTNSGSEATFAALRLARAVTGRNAIVKFQGTYHGWHDAVLMNVITPADRIGTQDPLSLGMLQSTLDQTVIVPWNDADAVERVLQTHPEGIAAILVEIIPHNIGVVLPQPGFLARLRALADRFGTVLIFDEVITGFRHDLGGYQKLQGVTPDLTTFAKAMANGYPIAALVGRAKYMDRFGPGGGVNFSGTYNGHPVGVAAALATIAELESGEVHQHTFRLSQRAGDGIAQIARELGIPMTVSRFGSVFVPYFYDGPVTCYEDLLANDTQRDVWFRRTMAERGVFMVPVALKRNHVSAAHTDADIDRTLELAREVLRELPA